MWRVAEWFPDINPETIKRLKAYHAELLKFNLRLNLISRTTEREADEVHFADSILAFRAIQKVGLSGKVHDIGSGNGLPGLIFALLSPTTEFHLVESDVRKCEFLKHVVHVLEISNANILNVRLESLAGTGVSQAVSRGFASVTKTLLTCNRLASKGARFFHLKGNSWSSEIAEIPTQLISVWSPELVAEYTLPASQARRAVVLTTKIA
ncbi:MAG: 16S rRNA (guanine(527)-N(7))-methyltransferase RsmG [Bdellovibrionales bacterium]